ncbi:RES domain-containing protein [Sphingorhabdus soli]|uniref:RES domain-containing protein n=1 Tax=Flavisphingopyxis soli TaxID=2601267 RepID=A0A5C6U8Z9_9SPHN|nr:RES family NAD+ phosphorylase [Sphingorhabdus soli]TXC68266.1 RES domain-containing protein [Sphingorhabdus soli]
MTFANHNAFRDFNRSVRGAFRYARTPDQAAFLDTVSLTSMSRVRKLKAGAYFYRAQLGHGWHKQELAPGEYEDFPGAHEPKHMIPDPHLVGEGRVNVKGIACLYLSTNEETAALEVRPLIGSYVSIAQFKIVRDLRIVDCSEKLVKNLFAFLNPNMTSEEIELHVWTEINDAFSAPVERADSGLTYVPTQIIAETLRLQGYDGIAYKSGYGEDGFNVALFDVSAAELRSCGLHRVGQMRVKLEMADNPYFVTDTGLARNEIVDIEPWSEPEA